MRLGRAEAGFRWCFKKRSASAIQKFKYEYRSTNTDTIYDTDGALPVHKATIVPHGQVLTLLALLVQKYKY